MSPRTRPFVYDFPFGFFFLFSIHSCVFSFSFRCELYICSVCSDAKQATVCGDDNDDDDDGDNINNDNNYGNKNISIKFDDNTNKMLSIDRVHCME